MKKTKLFFIFISLVGVSLVWGNMPSNKRTLQYTLKPKQEWEEKNINMLSDKITNYVLVKNPEVFPAIFGP